MKSTLFEHYKQKYKVGGTKVPVKKTGMWYQSGDVVVPSNNITMKGPKGEPDYFNNPILGTGVDTGATQIMQPGKDYNFPNDTAVYETKMKNGGQMIKRADGSYSRRGLWDNIRANKGSGKRPTKEMLQQERKIKAKMQDGGMTEEQQQRYNTYIKGYTNAPKKVSNYLPLPEWLNVDSETIDLAKKLKNIPADQKMNYAGDLTSKISDALHSGINYEVNTNLPRGLGNINFSGGYSAEQPLSVENLYRGMNYNMQFDKGSINVNPREQALELRGKGASLTYKRSASDEEKLNELILKSQVFPQLGITVGAKYSTPNGSGKLDPLSSNIPSYIANAAVEGQVGPLDYNVRGTYNPDTGYAYQGEGELNLLNNRLNFSGNFSGNQEEGINQYGIAAKANLAKGLNLKASYNKNDMNKPGQYNVGLTYNKYFQMGGGMSIPGVNGSVVGSTGGSVREAYKKRKKK